MLVPFDSERWLWGSAEHRVVEHLGRPCVRLDGASAVVTLRDVELEDGLVEIELAVGHERAFHGVVWRVQDAENYESFFVRPHQVGNPDAIQYTPVFNDVSAWQLYHGDGYWNSIAFPIDEWFRIRVAFAGERAQFHIAGEQALVSELKRPVRPGGIGLLVGGDGLALSGLSYDAAAPAVPAPRTPARGDGVVPVWLVSDPFAESALPGPHLDETFFAQRSWRPLEAEPSGLVNLARANGVRGGRNTVLARTTIRSDLEQVKRLDLGFSDRALVYLGGCALYRGDDSYRSRDYRFLGSIGWYDSLYLPLVEGDNELVVAVAEDFGGWGVQGRFPDPSGLTFKSRG